MNDAEMKLLVRLKVAALDGRMDVVDQCCRDLKAILQAMNGRGPTTPDNYRVLSRNGDGWWEHETGTRDYCIGYCDGGGGDVVACRNMIVYPDEQWGDEIEGPTK